MSLKNTPEFIGIGGHRCGSTWLGKHLKAHPNIYMPPTKELHFFSRKWSLKWYSPVLMQSTFLSTKAYGRYFNAPEARGKIKGEITPAYSILPAPAIEKIKKIVPDAKIIYAIRNPVDRVWSHITRGFEKYANTSVELASEQMLIDYINAPGVSARTNYVMTLRNWIPVFGREAIFIYQYETIHDDPQGLLNQIFAFLDLPEFEIDPEKLKVRVNKFPVDRKIPQAVSQYITEKFCGQKDEIEEMIGLELLWN